MMQKMQQLQRQSKPWIPECPACNSPDDVTTEYQTGDVICQKCGLVIC